MRRVTEASNGFILEIFVCDTLAIKQFLPLFLNGQGTDGYKFLMQLLRCLFAHPVQSAVFTLQGK